MKWRKREVKKLRVPCDLRLTEEVKVFTDALKDEFELSRPNVYLEGCLSLMERKKYILDCIWASDYVIAYRTKSTQRLSLKEYSKGERVKMYIYHIEPLSSSQVYLYYKTNCDTEDTKFKVCLQRIRNMKKEVADLFPVSVRKGMPSNE
ncbi:hypothetical protein QUF61_17540 [Candidatus Venteria ishoeyi]|uniref:hypothetical protein n=1 Tax=Candidatus Venteria ishoeyi TaxID=1899563 RepID=UPI0025A51472|nr:hypothetical protein [Candidatus Venteria ishoeyi]MDM8548298.1 hypothetical protein [Candidatus Venteria ishoeyi]